MSGLPKVKPGDLITDSFINSVVELINDLLVRVGTLETGAEASQLVRITAFEPPAPPAGEGQRVGQVLQIFGENFSWPPTTNTVTIRNFTVPSGGTAQIAEFRPGSKPTLLEFVIPSIAGIASGGTDVTVSVTSAGETTQATYRLRPALPTTGNPPTISKITKADGVTTNLSVTEDAIITGTNFSTSTVANGITIIIPLAASEIKYPDPTVPERAAPIQIISATTTEIRFRVPNMVEIDAGGRDVTLELKVGNFPSVERFVNISRG